MKLPEDEKKARMLISDKITEYSNGNISKFQKWVVQLNKADTLRFLKLSVLATPIPYSVDYWLHRVLRAYKRKKEGSI
jgi:hypothetical protein